MTKQNESTELHAIIHGQVQGVGFRAKVAYFADQLNLKGTVCNLPDGGVEILVQGARQELEQLLHHLKQDAGRGSVETIATDYRIPTKKYDRFTIIDR